MFIPDPDFTQPGSRISDPVSKNSNKREGWKKILVIPFYVATNFTKLKCLRKKFGPIFKEFLNFLPKKLSLSSEKYGLRIRDPKSGIRKKSIPDPGSRGQKVTRSRIPDPDPQH
jgi:hypothetical protein